MNNRLSVIVPILLLLSSYQLFAQPTTRSGGIQAQSEGSNLPAGGHAAAPARSGPAPASAFPDEKSLLIGGGQSAPTTHVKQVQSLGVWNFVQMFLVLALVVAGIYLLFYFLKRAGGPRSQETELITVLASRALQPNRSIHLIDVGGNIFLIGSSEASVSLVAAIEDKESIDEIRLKASQASSVTGRRNFRDVFTGVFQKGGNGFMFGGSLMQSMGFLKQQRERLRKM